MRNIELDSRFRGNDKKRSGLTLVELIIALMLVSVVLFGLYSITYTINFNSQGYSQTYVVASGTQATLNHILNNAALAVGSNTNVGSQSVLDQGVQFVPCPGVWVFKSPMCRFCIHQQPTGPGSDTWVCYNFGVFNPIANQITYCNVNYAPNDLNGVRGAGGACLVAPAQFLGTAYRIYSPFINPYYFNGPTYNLGTGIFSISIANCLDDSAASCDAGGGGFAGISSDPANNPEVVKTGSVATLQSGQ